MPHEYMLRLSVAIVPYGLCLLPLCLMPFCEAVCTIVSTLKGLQPLTVGGEGVGSLVG